MFYNLVAKAANHGVMDITRGGMVTEYFGGSTGNWHRPRLDMKKLFGCVTGIVLPLFVSIVNQLNGQDPDLQAFVAADVVPKQYVERFIQVTPVEPILFGLVRQSSRTIESQSGIVPEPSDKSTESLKPKADAAKALDYFPKQRPISQIEISVRSKAKSGDNSLPENLAQMVVGHVPTVRAASLNELDMRAAKSVGRKSHSVAYQPLYFEEPNLERYGRSPFRLHAAASAVRFYATIPALPYAMTVHSPHKTYFWDWPYEAGWCAPYVRELPPLDKQAALVEAGTLTGLFLLVP